jgi:hypothetical protein
MGGRSRAEISVGRAAARETKPKMAERTVAD